MCASERGGSDDLIMFRQPKSFRYPIRPHPPLEVPLLFSPGMLRTATPAERVRLVVALSEAGSSLCCSRSVSIFGLWVRLGARRTHCG